MPKLERHLEDAVKVYAKKRNVLCYKFSSPSMRGVPDRILIGPKGTVFLELKREGEKPTKLQAKHIRDINLFAEQSTTRASWVDNIAKARLVIDAIAGD